MMIIIILRLYVRARRNNKEVSKFCCVISCSFDDTEKHKNIEKWVFYIMLSFKFMIWALRWKYHFKGSSTCMSRVTLYATIDIKLQFYTYSNFNDTFCTQRYERILITPFRYTGVVFMPSLRWYGVIFGHDIILCISTTM